MEAAELKAFKELPPAVRRIFNVPLAGGPKFDWNIRVWISQFLMEYHDTVGRPERGLIVDRILLGDSDSGIMGMYERFPDMDPSCSPRNIDPKTNAAVYRDFVDVSFPSHSPEFL